MNDDIFDRQDLLGFSSRDVFRLGDRDTFRLDNDVFRLGGVGDSSQRIEVESRLDQDVRFDEDDVFLAIALDRNGASIDPRDLRDVTIRQTERVRSDSALNLDSDDVLTAIALGGDLRIRGGSGIFGLGDVSRDLDRTTSVTQRVDLDEDDVLAAIVLHNAVGGSLDLTDVADIQQRVRQDTRYDQDIDLDRDDALLLLALR